MYCRCFLALLLFLIGGYCPAQNQFGKLSPQYRQLIVKNHITGKIQSTAEFDDKGNTSLTSRLEIRFDSSGNYDQWAAYYNGRYSSSLKFKYNSRGVITGCNTYDSAKRLYSTKRYAFDSLGNAISFRVLGVNGKILEDEKSEYNEKNQLVKSFRLKLKKIGRNKYYLAHEYFYDSVGTCVVIKDYDEYKNLIATTVYEYDSVGNQVLIRSFYGKMITEFQENKYNDKKLLIESYWPKGWQGKGKSTKIVYTYDERDLIVEQKNYREDYLLLKTTITYLVKE